MSASAAIPPHWRRWLADARQGDPKEFALVVPVPTFIERDQINIADPG